MYIIHYIDLENVLCLVYTNFFLDLLKFVPNLLINKLMTKKFGSDYQNTSFLHNNFFMSA